jgi:hypothetical protein
MFLKNAWYVASTTKELSSRQIVGRTLLNEPIVLFRTESGMCPSGCLHSSSGSALAWACRGGKHPVRLPRRGV